MGFGTFRWAPVAAGLICYLLPPLRLAFGAPSFEERFYAANDER